VKYSFSFKTFLNISREVNQIRKFLNRFIRYLLAICRIIVCERHQILDAMVQKGKLDYIRALDVSHTMGLSENALYEFIRCQGRLLEGLLVYGKPKLTEQFFVNVIPLMRKIRCAHGRFCGGFFSGKNSLLSTLPD